LAKIAVRAANTADRLAAIHQFIMSSNIPFESLTCECESSIDKEDITLYPVEVEKEELWIH
jgi:hypothetical protein